MDNKSRTITLWFSKRIPSDFAESLIHLATVKDRSFTIIEAGEVDWNSGVDLVKASPLWASMLGVSITQRQDIDWRIPGEDIVGAVIAAADVQCAANSPEDYNPRLPPPDMGYLPESIPISVLDVPEVDVSEVGEELVMSSKLAKYLASLCDGRLGTVMRRGHVLAGFNRVFPESRASVLSEMNRGVEISCRLCGAPLIPALGIWTANSDSIVFPRPVIMDNLGIEHLGAQHRIVVDRTTARSLSVTFGDGLVLEPIYAASSETAAWVQQVIRAVWGE